MKSPNRWVLWSGVMALLATSLWAGGQEDDTLSPRVLLADPGEVLLRGRIVDQESGKPVAARLYIQSRSGQWYFPRSAVPEGQAIAYSKQFGNNPAIVEKHTTLSPHPFAISLPPGWYTITVEKGKEYLPFVKQIQVREDRESLEITIPIERWIDMASRDWFSGETHVHRPLKELPLVVLAENLNVTFPLTYWVTQAFKAPSAGDKSTGEEEPGNLMTVDSTHVIYPRNTEYEIFSVGENRHILGAFFVLNHKTVFEKGVPPVKPVADQAREEGALIELDKHAWEWSMALIPIMQVDLFELSNNHVWRTEFGFRDWGMAAPAYMNLERDARGGTEWAWIDYGFQNYYALLNSGFRLQPTAGTASGVHPVPLGYSRVYVKIPDGFSYEKWLAALKRGRSFVTTGPMLFATVDGEEPGQIFSFSEKSTPTVKAAGTVESIHPLRKIQVILNGEVASEIIPQNKKRGNRYQNRFDEKIPIQGSSWMVVRCFEAMPDGRLRFAHSAPWHFEIPGRPLRPRKEEAEFLVQRVAAELERSRGVLPEEAIREYEYALEKYQELAREARE